MSRGRRPGTRGASPFSANPPAGREARIPRHVHWTHTAESNSLAFMRNRTMRIRYLTVLAVLTAGAALTLGPPAPSQPPQPPPEQPNQQAGVDVQARGPVH